MMEQDWMSCHDPDTMLEYLQGKASDRKLRLFAVVCCRHTWSLVEDDRKRMVANGRNRGEVEFARREAVLAWRAAEVAERYADGLTDLAELRALVAADDEMEGCYADGSESAWTAKASAYRARCCAKYLSRGKHGLAARLLNPLVGPWFGVSSTLDHDREQSAQCHLLRDIFGNPFRSITLNPAWLTWHGGLLVSMARQVYDSRDFTDMPVLADALEEAGCDNADILNHCRQPGEHVRGCWVVDVLLNQS
jgi:hypothetical protein